jgi:hypothetical protein
MSSVRVLLKAIKTAFNKKRKHIFPPLLLLCARQSSSKKAGKPEGKIVFEERGDAKLHFLSHRRHMSAAGRER